MEGAFDCPLIVNWQWSLRKINCEIHKVVYCIKEYPWFLNIASVFKQVKQVYLILRREEIPYGLINFVKIILSNNESSDF